jgi:rhodanese-related sulfurtransferase
MLYLQAPELAARAAAEGFVLLDVREPWELQTARLALPGTTALDIPMREVPQQLARIPQTQPIACICHHGARSAQVVAFLMQQGYTDVYNLAGGIDAWSALVDPRVPRY